MSLTPQENIIAAAQRLVSEGLVARTWGNLSQRVSATTFYCTPSGRDYARLEPQDMVLCNLDGTFEGELKPTTERSIHALIYAERVDADFIVHTHQPYASAMSVGSGSYPVPAALGDLLGAGELPIANYGLPGQKKLHNAIIDTVRRTGSRAILMRSHGLIAFGRSAEEANEIALAVEAFCKEEYLKRASVVPVEQSELEVTTFERTVGELPAQVAEIFNKRDGVEVVLCDRDPVVLSTKPALRPFLDDFAQLVGIRMTSTPYARAVFGDDCVYYLGKDAEEALAVRMVVHKNALTATMARAFAQQPLGLIDRILMNAVYRLKYSKLKDAK